MLGKNPGLTVVAALTLALGIGANTAIFSVIYGVMFRAMPLPQPERIQKVQLELKGAAAQQDFTFKEFEFLREHSLWTDSMSAFTFVGFNVSDGGPGGRIRALHVSWNYFRALGLTPLMGRDFLAEEDRGAGSRVVLLSHTLWTQRFGGDAAILGKAIHLDGKLYTVIGVMPPGAEDGEHQLLGAIPAAFGYFDRIDAWTTLAPVARTIGSGENLTVMGRVLPGVTIAEAKAQLASLDEAFRNEFLEGEGKAQNLALASVAEAMSSEVRDYLWIQLAAVFCVLVIACVNVANLLLARGAGRTHEVAVRMALGASRGRVLRQFLAESVLLAGLGGAAGLLVGQAGLAWLLKLAPIQLPRLEGVRVDGWPLAFALGMSVVAGLVFGVAPAWQSSDMDTSTMLKESKGRGATGRRGGVLRDGLIVAEIAISLVLLMGGALLSRTFLNLLRINPGFDAKGMLSAEIWLTGSRYRSTAELSGLYDALLGRISRIPGVQSATVVSSGQPLERGGNLGVKIAGEMYGADYRVVTPEYFKALRIPLIKGRDFERSDSSTSAPVAIVNEAFVRRLLAGRDPLTASVTMEDDPPRAIVGVAADVKSHLDRPEPPVLFVSAAQASFPVTLAYDSWFPTHILVRASGRPLDLAMPLEAAIRETDPAIPLGRIVSMGQVLSRSLGLQHFMMVLVGVFAALALTLACVGLYGVMSYQVAQRTQEMGIRMALGARPRDVVRLVVSQGLRLTIVGLVIGSAAALGFSRVLGGLLYGVKSTDPMTLGIVVFLLSASALAACYVPARRATRVDPMVALRYE